MCDGEEAEGAGAAGAGSLYIQGGNTWIRWTQNGKRRTQSFPGCDATTTRTAKKVLADIVLRLKAGHHFDAGPAKKVAISVLAKDWLESRWDTKRAWRSDLNAWMKHVQPELGHMLPSEVDADTLSEFVKGRRRAGLNPSTVGGLMRLISGFFKHAIQKGHTEVNPARALDDDTKKRIEPTHRPEMTLILEQQADIARVFAALKPPFNVIFGLSVLGGLRPGEVVGLEWGDCHLDERVISVERSVRHGSVGPTKNGKSREVPIIPQLVAILAEWRAATGGQGVVFPPTWVRSAPGT